MTLSKHFETIEVRVMGRRSLSALGRGFFAMGMISPIFHGWGKVEVVTDS